MPHFELEHLQQLVTDGCWDFLNEVDGRAWYGRAWKLMDALGWSNADVKRLLLGLTSADFQKTVQNCAVNCLPGRTTVIADQYEIHWDERQCRRNDEPAAGCISLSLKLTIVSDEQGDFTGLVTLHASGS